MLRKLGDRLTLIGVAHVLPKSAAEVKTTIKRDRPELVAMELCPRRYEALTGGVQQAGTAEALRGGFGLFAFSKLLQLFQARFAHRTGMQVGKEMLTALRCAKEVGARVELIDRDIGLTLQRLVQLMSRREKIRLFAELLFGFIPLHPPIKLERVMEDQVIFQLLNSLRQILPTGYRVLIEERNEHMASEISRLLAEKKGKLVCVVGAGHIPGLTQRLAI